jgi:hypothetical protein
VRRLPLFAAVLVAAGCGGAVASEHVAATHDDRRPPTIVAVDEPAPADTDWLFDGAADLKDEGKAWWADVMASRAAPPRIVARADVGDGSTAQLIAWPNRARVVCAMLRVVNATDPDEPEAGTAPLGPCVPPLPARSACETLCLDAAIQWGDGRPDRYVLGGVVPAVATTLRVTLRGGDEHAYALDGPVVPESDWRAVILPLGVRNWRRLELVARNRVLETRVMSADDVAAEECSDAVSPDASMQCLQSGAGGIVSP